MVNNNLTREEEVGRDIQEVELHKQEEDNLLVVAER